MIEKTRVFLRADGNARIGLGHVHRLLALSEILGGAFECIFVIKGGSDEIGQLLAQSCGDVINLPEETLKEEEIELLSRSTRGKEIIVLDGYGFDTGYQQQLREKGNAIVSIDDIHSFHFVSDLIINPSGGVTEKDYSLSSYSRLVTGPKFALTKRHFREAAKNKKKVHRSGTILICMGGADPENFTVSVLRQLDLESFQKCILIVGGAYQHHEVLAAEEVTSNGKIRIHRNVTAALMADLMKEAEVAICSASGVAYEYLSIGGELYIIQTADNQSSLYRYLINEGLAFPYASFRVGSEEARTSYRRQCEIFDGQSDIRVLKLFHEIDFRLNGSMREVASGDVNILFEWANDPDVRRNSYNSAAIPFEDHQAWFFKKLADDSSSIFIFEYKNNPVGMVRFDVGDEIIISYLLDKKFRGRSWGVQVLSQAINAIQEQVGKDRKIVGFVKEDNHGSNHIFAKIGFRRVPTDRYPNSFKYELTTT